jgi:hypothetical protein
MQGNGIGPRPPVFNGMQVLIDTACICKRSGVSSAALGAHIDPFADMLPAQTRTCYGTL